MVAGGSRCRRDMQLIHHVKAEGQAALQAGLVGRARGKRRGNARREEQGCMGAGLGT